MIVSELIEQLEQLPHNAKICLFIDDRVDKRELNIDLSHIRFEGYFEKKEWENTKRLVQIVYMEGVRK